ncbi:MAG: polysaccharide deacetylase family protein [Pseudomonadota bacterium]
MSAPKSGVYHRLAPFRDWFRGGLPILTYHKLGAPARGAKLKGLYARERMFDRQLHELHKAGFVSATLDEAAHGVAKPDRVVITFDDAYVNVLRHGLEPLARYKFQAMQYVVADAIGGTNHWDVKWGEAAEQLMDAAQLREWLAAGHAIGSHTSSHVNLAKVPLAKAREEISASKKKLENLFGIPIRHFCYPYGGWNAAVRDLVMEAGYETATTLDFGLNTPATPKLELKRLMARHQSWGLKAIRARYFG